MDNGLSTMNFNIDKIIRPNIKAVKPYSSARDEFEGDASVFLDANENPYDNNLNRYPDPHQKKLKERIASIKNTDEQRIFFGNGSDEAIDLLFRAFCEPSVDEILITQPTYGMYAVSASINNVKINSVNLTSDFNLDVDATLKAITSKTKIIFLCSPNNPSGNLLKHESIIHIIENFNGIVVIDEAYIDFTSSPSFIAKLNDYKNLVVLQTLSKAWGLAGLRLGMCFANKEIIDVLNKIKPPYNISSVAQSLALEKLSAIELKEKQVNEIIAERKAMEERLLQVNSVTKIFPSDANFILIRIKNANRVYNDLLQKGIVVRNRSTVILCDDCLRITVGTPEENQKLIDALKTL